MDYKILTSSSASGLQTMVTNAMLSDWKPIGGHQAVESYHQPKYAGKQLMATQIKGEYSQTLIKE